MGANTNGDVAVVAGTGRLAFQHGHLARSCDFCDTTKLADIQRANLQRMAECLREAMDVLESVERHWCGRMHGGGGMKRQIARVIDTAVDVLIEVDAPDPIRHQSEGSGSVFTAGLDADDASD